MRRIRTILQQAVVALATACLFFVGCNPIKKAGKRQEQMDAVIQNYIASHPPRIDTNTVFIKGKVDSIAYPVAIVDTNALRRFKDSLSNAMAEKYGDDASDCSRQVNEAFDVGYKQAMSLAQKIKIPVCHPDTIVRTVYNTDAVNDLQKENARLRGIIEQMKDSHPDKWLWYFIISAAINGVFIFGFIKRLLKPKLL